MSVNRYEFEDYGTNEPDGRYVTYEDYAALEAKCAALAAENAGLKSAIEKHADSYIMCGYCRTERDGKIDDVCEVLDSIPATDAFLAEVRAQGVEMLHAVFNQAGCVGSPELHSAMNTFMLNIASKIRNGEFAVECKGVQS
ncbi:hypothetical protein [Enterobacter hormaechei]|uniref:hypothetical protein n=1 Tax=Enterobacter hormaechei TaxID=158836 RepID=UPI001D089B9B|nr:hypothetical protein [Enterobacter hormaechei]